MRVGRKGEPANLKGGLSLTSEEPLWILSARLGSDDNYAVTKL